MYISFVESHCLVYWEEEEATSVVESKKTDVKEWVVGASCLVKAGKKQYSGRLAAWGKLCSYSIHVLTAVNNARALKMFERCFNLSL